MTNKKQQNEQMSILYTLSVMLNNGVSFVTAVVRTANLARSYGWTEEEIEALCETLEPHNQFDKAFFSEAVKELD